MSTGLTCPYFSFGQALAERMNSRQADLSNYIKRYNDWATINNAKLIRSEEYESANEKRKSELLDEYARRINRYLSTIERKARMDDANTNEKLRNAIGSNAAYSSYIVTKMLEPSDIISFKNEFLYCIRKIANAFNADVETLISKRNIKALFNDIKKLYIQSYFSSLKSRKNLNDELTKLKDDVVSSEYKELKAKIDDVNDRINYLERIIGRATKDNGKITFAGDSYFNELCITNMSEFKKVFGRGYNPDNNNLFKADDIDNIHVDDEGFYTLEENVRERWQTVLDSVDPSGSLSSIINNIISQTPRMSVKIKGRLENGNPVYEKTYVSDRFTKGLIFENKNGEIERVPVYCNARQEARILMKLLNSSISIADMMYKLANTPKYETLYNFLAGDVTLQTTFFQAFNKYYQTYYYTKTNNGTLDDLNLNKTGKGDVVNSHLYAIQKENYEHSANSIFQSSVNKQIGFSMAKYNSLKNYFDEKVGSDFSKFDIAKDKNTIVEMLLGFFDVSMNADTSIAILNDRITTESLLNNINNFITLIKKRRYPEDKFFDLSALKGLLSKEIQGEQNPIYFSVKNILDVVESTNDFGKEITGMITYASEDGNKTLSTNIMMSHLTNLAKFFNNAEPENLQRMIAETFSSDETFYDSKNKKYRLRWLEDLYNSADQTSAKSFRKLFSISRNLGINKTSFENISDKGHMLTLLSMYFNSLNETDSIVNIDGNKIRNTGNFSSDLRDAIYDQTGQKADHKKRYVLNNSVTAYSFDANLQNVYKASRSNKCTLPTYLTADTVALRGVTSLHYSIDEIIDGMYDMFMMDISTCKKGMLFNSLGLPMGGNGKETPLTSKPDTFGFLNFFNPDFVSIRRDENGEFKEEKGYWNKRLADIGGVNALESDVKNLIREYFDQRTDVFINNDMVKLNVGEEIKITEKGYYESMEDNIKDFLMNYYFSIYNQVGLTNVSPKFYMDAEDANKRNKGVLTNGMCLVADAIDPKTNQPLFENSLNPTQNVVYIYDVKPMLSERDRTMLTKVFGSDKEATKYVNDVYGSSSLTDGEGWRSFSSWRKIGLAFGDSVWTREMEKSYWDIQKISNEIYKTEDEIEKLKAKSKEEFTLNEGSLEENQNRFNETKNNESKIKAKQDYIESLIQQIEDAAVVFQPRKPMCDGLENYRGMVIPFQHKYAEIPIIPCLFPKGSAMRELGLFMEQNNIDMVCSDKCGKKGVFGEADVQFKTNKLGQYIDNDGNVITGYDAFKNEVDNPTRGEQRRNKNFYKLAVENRDESITNVLNKQFWNTNSVGKIENTTDNRVVVPVIHQCSLKNYLIMNNVPDHVETGALFGNQIRKIIISGIDNNKSYSYKFGGKLKTIKGKELIKLYNALICSNYFSSFANFRKLLNDPQRLLKEMSNNILSNDRCDTSTIDKLIDGMPFWDASLQHDTFATLISMFRNSVVKQKINGGNVVQASALGSDMSIKYLNDDLGFETDADGYPTKCECIMPFNFSYKDSFGNKIQLKYSDYCNADGTFKLDKDGNTLIENDFPGILDVIAYRIPTEAEYSCFALKIKRCCPRSGRNYIQLPTITTTRAGFDFDIDKLYLMRKSFNAEQSDYRLKQVWDKIFEANPDIADALKEARSRASQNEIDSILKKYSEAGFEEPKVEDIPLNRFWDIAEKRGLVTADKTKLFNSFVKDHPEYIESSSFEDLDIFDDNNEIDYSKIFSTKISQDKIDNIILEIMLQRLTDPELAKASFTAGGFEDTSKDASFINAIKAKSESNLNISDNDGIKELNLVEYYNYDNIKKILGEKTNYDFADPITAIRINQLNQVAAKLIGIYANDSANYNIFANVDEMKITGKIQPIVFGSLIKADFPNKGLDLLVKESNGKTVKQRLAELLAASVDAVKDPVLNYLNLNTVTGEAATVLVRLGYDIKDVGLLFNQPIISECLSYMSREGVSNISQAMNYVLKQHGMGKISNIKKSTNVDTRYLTREALAYNIADKYISDDYYAKSQAQVVKLFMDLMTVKDEFSSIVQQTRNTSSNVVKATLGDYMSRKERIDNYNESPKVISIKVGGKEGIGINSVNKPISTTKDRLEFFDEFKDIPFAFENIVYNIIDKAMQSMISDNTPYNVGLFNKIFANAKYMCNYGTLSADFINSIGTEGAGIILSEMNGDFNPNAINEDKEINPNGLTNAELYLMHLDDFINRLEKNQTNEMEFEELRNSFVTNVKIVDRSIVSNTDSNGNVTSYTKLALKPNYNLPKEYKSQIITQWFYMASNQNKYLRDFAKALFLHLYYNYGLNNSRNFDVSFVPSNIYNLVSADYNSELSYNDFMNGLIDEDIDNSVKDAVSDINEIDIILNWAKQHNDNKQFVYRVNNSVKNSFSESNGGNTITVSISDSYLVTHTKNKVTYASPFVLYNNKLYIYSGLNGVNKSIEDLKVQRNQPISYNLIEQEANKDFVNFLNSDNKYLFGGFDIKEKSMTLEEDSYTGNIEQSVEPTQSERDFNESVLRNENKDIGLC